MTSLPLTPLRGIVLPGLYNYDGHWFGGLRKDRVKRLFGTPWEWFDHPVLKHFQFEIGLNVISRNASEYWGDRYRIDVIYLLSDHYDMKCQIFDEDKQTFNEWDLNENSLYHMFPKHITPMVLTRSNIDGGIVGNLEIALAMLRDGIKPQKAHHKASGCSIGFCEREQKWYGWSPRAMFGFGVGYVAKEGSCVVSSGWDDEYLATHPEANISVPVGFEAKTLDDCRRLACAFAESVS